MELNHTIYNGEIVPKSNLTPWNFLFWNYLKIELKNKSYK